MQKNKIFTLLAFILFFLAFFQIFLNIAEILTHSDLIDFKVYYQAAKDFLSGKNPYQQTYYLNIPFNYPPSSFWLFLPAAFLPIKFAQSLWLLLSFLALFLQAALFFKVCIPKVNLFFKLILLSLLLQNFPTKFTLVMGQVNFFVLFLIALCFYFYVSGRSLWSGFFLGLAVSVKLMPGILLIFFLSRKRIKVVFSSLLTFGATTLLAVLLSSWSLLVYYLKRIFFPLLRLPNQGIYYDHSVSSFLTHLEIGPGLKALLNFLVFFLGFLFLVARFRRRVSVNRELGYFSLGLLLGTMTNKFAWQHHLVFLFPAFLAASFRLLKSRSILYGAFLAFSALLAGFHFKDQGNPFLTCPLVASHGLAGAFILFLLVAYEGK